VFFVVEVEVELDDDVEVEWIELMEDEWDV
jgi:hypothetical protein